MSDFITVVQFDLIRTPGKTLALLLACTGHWKHEQEEEEGFFLPVKSFVLSAFLAESTGTDPNLPIKGI